MRPDQPRAGRGRRLSAPTLAGLVLLAALPLAATPPAPAAPAPPPPVAFTRTAGDLGGDRRPAAGDFDGDGADDLAWYGDGPDEVAFGGSGGAFTSLPLTAPDGAKAVVGDYDGDGHDDIAWHGAGADEMAFGRADRTFTSSALAAPDGHKPVVGDYDGDGNDDLLVSVADGYLYGLKNAPLRGPGIVRDLDPATASGDDIDEVTTRDTLSASWDPVPGATSYEVAIAKADGGYVFYPPWQPVDATSYTRTGLALEDGVQYVFAVRAVSAAGRSPDILSDGVVVHRIGPPVGDAGVGEPDAGAVTTQPGGCCSTGGAPVPAVALGGLVALVLGRRRRR